jgi:predicted secreted protein
MSTTTAIAIYFLIWWVTLFAVLPFGVRSQHEDGGFAQGTDPGAPVAARLLRKLIWTTVIASAIFAVVALVYEYRLVTLDDLAALFGMRR